MSNFEVSSFQGYFGCFKNEQGKERKGKERKVVKKLRNTGKKKAGNAGIGELFFFSVLQKKKKLGRSDDGKQNI